MMVLGNGLTSNERRRRMQTKELDGMQSGKAYIETGGILIRVVLQFKPKLLEVGALTIDLKVRREFPCIIHA